jgi:hypothetical protein
MSALTATGPTTASHAYALGVLERAGVSWALVRGAEGVDREGADLDVLVAEADLATAVQALETAGYAVLPAVEPYARSLVRRDPATEDWSLIDLTTRFAFGPVPKLRVRVEREVLGRAEWKDGVRRVAPPDAFWLLLLHAVLDHDRFDDRHRRHLTSLLPASRADDVVARVIDTVPAAPVAARLRALVDAADWAGVEQAVRELHGSVAPSGAGARRVVSRVGRISRRLPAMLRRPGISVAIIGPDGSGKSTLVRDLPEGLPVPTRTRYLGLFGAGHRRAPVPGLGFLGRIGRVWRGAIADAAALARGRIVIYDRYPYDMLRARGSESTGRRLRRWIEAHAAPPPDLVILLDAPAEQLHARRPEHSVEELRDLLEHYRSIAAGLDRVTVLDATAPAADVRRAAIDAIWRVYAAHQRA